MPAHKKPTKEELEAAALKAAEEAEALANKGASPSASPEVPSPSPSPDAPSPSPSPPAPSPSPSPGPYKKKFIESSREAMVIRSQSKKVNEAIDQASQLSDPTEEELRVQYPEWDDMTETEKKLATTNFKNDKRFQLIHSAAQEGKNIEEWNTKVDTFIGDPKTLADNPELEGKQEDFKIFAMKPTRRGIPFEDLISAFLYDVTRDMKPKKKQMFPAGSAGPSDKVKPKSDKISLEESRVLRQNNYPKYLEYLKAGKIDTSDITA